MNIIIQSAIHTLNKSKVLLSSLSDEILSDHSVSPYYSCIGSHIRHILDFYNCVLNGIPGKFIDLTNRERDERMHSDCNFALANIELVIKAIQNLEGINTSQVLKVNDDLGLGEVEIEYTLGAVLAQANSHAIHHYAIISYILDRLSIEIKDETFGYNPTTPRPEINLS